MITSDSGLSVRNYIGTYHLKKYDDTFIIVSEEFHNPRGNELPLKTKTLYVDDFKTNDYLLLRLANVDITKTESILEFCNKYGLPYSSAIIDDINPGYYLWGLEIPENQYAQMYPFYRNDYMLLDEFYRHARCARMLMEVKNELEATQPNYNNLLNYLLPMLLSFRSELYICDEIEPTTATTRFQKYFLQTCSKYQKKNPDSSFNDQVNFFLVEFKKDITRPHETLFSPDIRSGYWIALANLLLDLTKSNLLKCIQFDKLHQLSFQIKESIPNTIENKLLKIGPRILIDTINEGLSQIHPKLSYVDGHYINDWDIRFQYEGLLVELSLLLSAGNQIKKCANPTCEKFFTSNGHRNKMYCSERCGKLVAKRRQRQRDAENPNRPRLEPGFKSKKRKKI